MKFAIVSDTHDNMANFSKVIDFLNTQNIKVMLHCGDICNQTTIDEAVKNFNGGIKFVRGNGDFELENIPETMEIELGGNPSTGLKAKKIFFNHYPNIAKKMAESGSYDLVFYGHTHRSWEEKIGNCRLINPGEIAGQRYKPCFAIYDTENDHLELKILELLT
jgi:putative phosphoesterase